MLAIHWSPVKNTKNILKNGISKSKNGLYCYPLTGNKQIDSWWAKAFNLKGYKKHRNQYNGFVFKIVKEDLPGCFDHGYGYTAWDNFKMNIKTLEELELRYRDRIINKIGEKIIKQKFINSEEFKKLSTKLYREYSFIYTSMDDPILIENTFDDWLESQVDDQYAPIIDIFMEAGKNELKKNKNIIDESLNDKSFLEDTFSDWQIILSRSISKERIIKIVSNRNEYGKILYKNKKYKNDCTS